LIVELAVNSQSNYPITRLSNYPIQDPHVRRARANERGKPRAKADEQFSSGPQKLRAWLPIILIAGAIGTYVNAGSGQFVLDDITAVVENPHIRRLWPLTSAMTGPVQSSVAGRPIVSLSLALNYAFGGLSPSGYHLFNLLVHICCGLLLFGILRRTFSLPSMPAWVRDAGEALAFASVLIWLVHPLQSEIVNYVTQRTEAMMALFYLLTLYAVIRASTSPSPGRWSAVALIACALGMASKETMVTAPIVVLLYDALFLAGSLSKALARRRWLYLGLAGTWAVLLILIAPGPRWRSAGFASGVSPVTYLLNQPAMILTYLKLAVWPDALVLDYGITKPATFGAVWPMLVAIVAMLAASAALWRRWPAVAFAAAWFWIILAPSSSILPIATEVGAERRMYLPLAAVVVLVAVGFEMLRRRAGIRTGWLSMTALAAVSLTFVGLTLARNREYRSAERVWQTVLERRPQGRAHYNLAMLLRNRGAVSEAAPHWQAAIEDEPRALYAIGLEHEKMNQYDEASKYYSQFLERKPDDIQAPQAHVRLGVVLTGLNRLDDAAAALSKAAEMRPSDADAKVALADVLMKKEQYGEAAAQYAQYVRLVDNNPDAYAKLGLALVALHREAEAIPYFERAAVLAPADAGLRLSLGNVLAASGRVEDAIHQFRRGIELEPKSPILRRMLADALIRVGRLDEALEAVRAALVLEPDDPETRTAFQDLSRALRSK
jgi:tetratricopeptide (TPR) repeat protein